MALVSGYLFDKIGVGVLLLPFVLSVFPSFLVQSRGFSGVVAACVVFGLVLGAQESTYRAAMACLVPLGKIGTAYGIFNSILGLGTLASGFVFGFFTGQSYPATVLAGFAVVFQIGAILTPTGDRQLFSDSMQNQ